MAEKLNVKDVQRLLADSSGQVRAETATKIADQYGNMALTDNERKIAEDIFRIMVKDAEVRVRQALSSQLKDCPTLERDVAMALANDIEQVSLPMLQFSQALSDEDLIEIVRSSSPEKQQAIARRETVSSRLADELVATDSEPVISALVANEGADISEETMDKVIDKFGDRPTVSEPMAMRGKLPIRVAERLLHLVSERIQEHLIAHHDLPPDTVSDVVMQSRERATLGLVGPNANPIDVETLVQQLHENDRLTPSIILRALCTGDMPFFELALAQLANIPAVNARALIHEEGQLGLRALLGKTGIPEEMYPAFRAGVEVSHENHYDGGENDRERFRRRMIERMLTLFEDPDAQIGDENTEYLLGKLAQIDAGFIAAA